MPEKILDISDGLDRGHCCDEAIPEYAELLYRCGKCPRIVVSHDDLISAINVMVIALPVSGRPVAHARREVFDKDRQALRTGQAGRGPLRHDPGEKGKEGRCRLRPGGRDCRRGDLRKGQDAPGGDMQDTWGRMRLMKLGQVRSSTSPAGRRRREIGGMAGWTAARPLTSKNMARLPLLTKPDALSIVSDACLGYDRRDVVEGAFRLSFHLEGGARNPFLDTPAAFRAFPRDRGDPALRATSIGVAAGPAFLAIGATFPNRDRFHDEHKTGAGFMALRFAGGITFSARPALTSEGWSAPEGHRRLIEAALTELTAAGDWPQDRVLEGFETAWTAMAKRCGALPWPLTR